MLYLKPLASYWSPTALKRPDRSKQTGSCLTKLVHWYILTTFPHRQIMQKVLLQIMQKVLLHYLSTFLKTFIKTEVSKCLLNIVYRLETHPILVPALHKIAISRKTKFFGTFSIFFLVSMDLWHHLPNYSIRFDAIRFIKI